MTEVYTLPPGLAGGGPIRVHLAGAGGNGSHVLTGLAALHLALIGLGHTHGLEVAVFDPDTVSEANLGRQPFAPADLGLPKALVLVNQINLRFGTDWRADAMPYPPETSEAAPHILITCVDTARARREIGAALPDDRNRPLLWLDLGNRRHDGQVVLGEPGTDGLPTVLELFPEIADPGFSEPDPGESCGMADALARQGLFVNRHLATWAVQILADLLLEGRIAYHGVFLNTRTGRTSALPIDPAAWARIRGGPRPDHGRTS